MNWAELTISRNVWRMTVCVARTKPVHFICCPSLRRGHLTPVRRSISNVNSSPISSTCSTTRLFGASGSTVRSRRYRPSPRRPFLASHRQCRPKAATAIAATTSRWHPMASSRLTLLSLQLLWHHPWRHYKPKTLTKRKRKSTWWETLWSHSRLPGDSRQLSTVSNSQNRRASCSD